MKIITIREEKQTETGFEATLSFDNNLEYPITITNPFNFKQEQRLEWYFEEWLEYPMLEQVKAENAADSIKTYGENLFEQVFANKDAYKNYEQLRWQLNQVKIEIVSRTPEFQALHWEALRDPDLPRPLAVECVLLRRYIKPVRTKAHVKESPVVNLLVVVARPDEEHDVGYQTISRPLIEAIENSQLRVNVHLLRPGTYEALERHLEQKGAGYYHVIHFDVHGALMTYQQFQNSWVTNRLDLRGYGLEDLQPYEGFKAFIFLEGEKKGNAVPVEATELGSLLTGKMIPVCILTTCQSGKQIHLNTELPQEEDYRDTSLASHLMTTGMQMVVAMGYSVTVTAAKLMAEEFYTHLFADKGIENAVRLARRSLFNNKQRRAYFNETLKLEDWLLPVVYCNQEVNLNLRDFTPEEEEKYYNYLANLYYFSQPSYGFVGRDLEILKLEKALLRHNIVLLEGMGGSGKTTLLNYLRKWWPTTNFAEDVFYFGYDRKAWTLEQIVWEVGESIFDERNNFHRLLPRAKQQKLLKTLRANNYILILDNLESMTGVKLAIENTLRSDERNLIRDFLSRLVRGKTKVILGSRSGEDWLKEKTFENNVYELKGLDLEARTLLAQRILERNVRGNRIGKIKEDEKFERLMKVLAGYPLAMEVVLANLKNQSPGEVLEELQAVPEPSRRAADVSMDSGSEDKTRSILKCVEYSHSNLSADAQKLLLCLALFSGFIHRGPISIYGKQLEKLELFKDYPFSEFDLAIEEAINWGLLSPNQDNPQLLTIQPVLPYFLKAKLNELDEETREALWEGFKNHYIQLASFYNELMNSKEIQERQWGIFFCRLEYENLYNALLLCLKKHETVDIFFCLNEYLDLIKDFATKLKLAEFVWETQKTYPEKIRTGKIGLDIVRTLSILADSYSDTKNYSQAKESYKQAIELTQQLRGIEEKQKQLTLANGYHGLGNVALELREWHEARNNYQQALAIYIEYSDRYSQANTYQNLGRVASELREWHEARNNYQQALAIYIEYSDRYSQASTYHQLGNVALELREWDEARNNYQQALSIYIEYGDRHSQAVTYQQLGTVALELRGWDEARSNYQQALAIYIEYGDRYSLAPIYHSLGMVAQELREWDETRNNYQQALAIFIEYGDRYSQAGTYHNLGVVASELREWDEARNNYQQALAIFIEYGDRYSQAKTYHQLGNVALELRGWDEARNNYQQALAIFIEYGDRYSQAKTYHNLGVVASELREWDEARNNYQQALAIYIEYGDRYSQAKTYHQLGNVALELRGWDEARNNYQQALAIFIEYGDRYSQAKTYHNLGVVASELREWDEARNNYQQALAIYIEYGDRYSQAGTYHNLGLVASKLREWDEAGSNYQQALAIYIEYSDRYSQAGTYHCLGTVAEKLEEYSKAKANYLQALQNWAEFNDRYSLETFSIPALARLYGKIQDSSLLAQVASILGVKVEELKQIFAQIVGEKLENYQQAVTNIEYSESQEKASTYNNLDRIELEKFSKEQNPLLNISNTILILDRETKYGMLSSLRTQNQIPIDFIPLGNLFYQEYDFLNLVFDSKQKLIEVSEKERMRLFKDIWNAVDSALEYNQIEVFRTKVDELTKLFCQSLAFTMLDDSSTLGQFYGQMIDASNSAFQLNIRPNFPLIYPCKTEFTEEDVYKISGLLNKFGIVAHFFALIIDFGNNPEMNQQVRESAYKNDFIVLNRDKIWDILAAKSPVQQLTNCILEQIDLVAISPYTVSGPVKRKMFFGRAKEEKILLQNIDRNNYALLANRKTGKTSLLNTIYPLLKSLPTYQVFYCDLQVVNNYDIFYQELALAYPELEEEIAKFSHTSPLLLHRLIRNLNQQSNNRKLIFIFDEVDELLAYDLENQEQLFKTFRSLSQRENIGFIFSGTTTLVKRMRHPHSPLFNFCSPLKIGFLEEKAAEELIRVPMKTLGVKFENESAIVQDLLKLTVGHPNTIQYICDSLIQIINQKQRRIITEEYVDEVVTSQAFYEYFESLIWGQSTALEKLIVYLMWSYQEFTDSELIEEFKRRNIPIEGVKSSLETLLIYSTLSKKNNKYYFTFKEFAKLMKKRSDIEELTEQYQLEVISCPAALSL